MTKNTPRPKPERVTGIAHIFAATSYSLSGIRRLWDETAFRHEVLIYVLTLILFVALGVPVVNMAILTGLFLLLVAVEALNTAVECIVDHLSPDWQLYAKNAKDLGSLAVMCCLLAAGLFIGFVLLEHFGFL